jgi:hypothetical protein
MGKCLVTKLSSSVDNEELIKVDEFKVELANIHVDGDVSYRYTSLNGTYLDKPAALRIIGATFPNGSKRNEISYSGDDAVISGGVSIPNKATAFIVENKYKLTGVSMPLESIGDLSMFEYLTKLFNIRIYSREWTGSINKLRNLVNLTSLDISNGTHFTGDIQSLATSLFNAGKKTGTLKIMVNLKSNILFKSKPIDSKSYTATFSSSGAVVTKDS